MIMKYVRSISIAMPALPIPQRPIIICCALSPSSTFNTQHLRSQLDHLHSEAHHTTTKANSARLRLLRLSEAADKLQKQAAIRIQKGEENDAREMLYQRKKVLQALENTKRRIELLDELSIKLSEAISLKESQLIGNTMNIEDTPEDASSPVRIIAPKEEVQNDFTYDDLNPNTMKLSDVRDVQLSVESEGNPNDEKETENFQGSLSNSSWNEKNIASSLSEISSYEAFMEHIDQKLSEIEAELVTVLNVSTLVLNSKERPNNLRLQQIMELLDSIHGIRQRISSLGQTV
ncbi:hypothetical protein Lal_00013572 [Lupinus albus]|uniref:Uncharacterized protein n=1 Tax=Lupinus albus TaxID=3870 RepID=A0A6A5NZG7_LUPAL|nr:hypothetical protein Lalb_Chr10g0106631 [Lupinus albus]KAF1890318.1 hypothetical protein Lal_00013572 [Lupinus albus]